MTFFHDGYRDGYMGDPESPPDPMWSDYHRDSTDVFGAEYRDGYREGKAARESDNS